MDMSKAFFAASSGHEEPIQQEGLRDIRVFSSYIGEISI